MASSLQIDLGQGVLRVIEDIHKELNKDLHNIGGYLVKDNL